MKKGDTFTIRSKLYVNGKIIVQGALDNLSANSLNITGSGAVIIEEDAILNNGNGKDLKGFLGNSGSLVVYGTLNNKSGSDIDNYAYGEVSYVGTINNDGTILNKKGIFYQSVLGNPEFDGKPESIIPKDGLFGTLSKNKTYNNLSDVIIVPKNTGLINNGTINNYQASITIFGVISNSNTIVNYTGRILNYGSIENKKLIRNDREIYNDGKICNILPDGKIDSSRGTISGNPPGKNC